MPTGSLLRAVFSDVVPAERLQCSAAGICFEGPSGPIAVEGATEGTGVILRPTLDEDTTYRLTIGEGIAGRAASVTFRTRTTRPRPGRMASLVLADAGPWQLDTAPLRLTFDEPLDPFTLSAVLRGPGDAGVSGTLDVSGTKVSFSPDAVLTAGQPYRLEVSGRDVGGEPFAVAFQATPRGGRKFEQTLGVTPNSATSRPIAGPVNRTTLSSQLIGTETLTVQSGTLMTELGDPTAFGGPIAIRIPKGQQLTLSSLNVRYGGALPAGLRTGTITFTLLNDGSGVMLRNPWRDPNGLPDDVRSPIFADISLDAVLTSTDPLGTVLATQTIMGLRLVGVAKIDGKQLSLQLIGALEFTLLGVNTANANLVLEMNTGAPRSPPATPLPELVSMSPVDGSRQVAADAPLHFNFSAPILLKGVTADLTPPLTARLRADGASIIVEPRQRFADATNYTVRLSGLKSLQGVAMPDVTQRFTIAPQSRNQPAAPYVTALVPGAPCALVRSAATSPGACAGSPSSDSTYRPFTLAANLPVRIELSQPINISTVVGGATCGRGAFRVERLDSMGRCVGVVPGLLRVDERLIRFIPAAPWAVDETFRLTLVGGADDRCGADELCSRGGQPLNTDLLTGVGGAKGGGPDVVILFRGAPVTGDSLQPLESNPFSDANGNGRLDTEETMTEGNRVAMEITQVGGIVSSASLKGTDCLPNRPGLQTCAALHATLPVQVGQLLSTCPLDAQVRPSSAAAPCIEVRVFPSLIVGTSLTLDANAVGLLPINDLPTGPLIMRVRETGAPSLGYILMENGAPQFVAVTRVYLDAPDLSILGGLAGHDLSSKQLSLAMKGPVTFRADGRMDVSLRTVEDVTFQVGLTALGLGGSINMRIPAGELRLGLAGPLLR